MMARRKIRAKGDHTIEECNHTVNSVPIHYHPPTAKEGKPQITLVSGTGKCESIIIPSREPLAIPGILEKKDFERLKKQAKVLSNEERNALLKEAEQRKKQQHVDSDKRKELLRKLHNKAPEKGSILDEAEMEATKKNQYMLQRARELRQEQEDEVKTLNGIILASKCLAIREAQIAEKKIIAKELEDEERRLDLMMEQERQRAMQEEKEKQKEIELRNRQFVGQVKEQLKVNEIHALIDREKREEEARTSNKLLIAFQKAQLEEIQEKKKKQEQTREDLRKANESATKFKQMKEEEERMIDLRLKQFMEQKEKEEEERKQQQAILKQCKDSDIQRLGEKSEKANCWRLKGRAERDWRKNEKEKAIKRKEGIEKLRIERQKQIDDIREAQALEIARDQEQFSNVCKIQRKQYEREIEKRKEDKLKAEQNRRELLKQVNFKEKQRIDRRRLKMEEGEAMRLEDELRKVDLLETLERKLNALGESSIPERTIQDIRRQAEKKIKAHLL
ncbi:cilia- and flagella-associated protein 45-like [Atheta coriaria]|uniref:cilia- and flagella-associated protein 45-like n=1 Tax=Dalotia coriaria TaxID=877792 RepID=UPI0031F374A2